MKRLIVAGMMVLCGANMSYAGIGCKELEYAELKDMSAVELQAEIKKYADYEVDLMSRAREALGHGWTQLADEAIAGAGACTIQGKRMQKVLDKMPAIK